MNAQLIADPKAFSNALSSFATGVTVVTTAEDNYGDIGLTANSFNSVSLDPPMILWSLAKSSLSLSAFKAASYIAVHILGEEQDQPGALQKLHAIESEFPAARIHYEE